MTDLKWLWIDIQEKVGLTITDEAEAERKIVIYYDHDSSDISPEDQAYLSAEVGRIPMHDKVSLTVVGHADRTVQNDIIIIYLLREPLVFTGLYQIMA